MARFCDVHRRLAVRGAAEGPEVHVPRHAGKELHRQDRECETPASFASPRRRFAATRYFSAGRISTSSAFCRRKRNISGSWQRRAGQTRTTDRRTPRPQGIRRAVGAEMGRIASDEILATCQLQVDPALLQLAQEQIANNVPIDQWVQELLGASWRHVQEPAHELLSERNRHIESHGECRPSVHGHADRSAPSATTIRSTAGRWTTTTVSRRSSSQIGRKRATIPRARRLQQRRRRGESPRERPRDAAEIPRRRHSRRRGRQRPPRGDGQLARVAREPVLRDQSRQSHLGTISSARASSMKWMMSASATRASNARCSPNSARSSPISITISRTLSATSATRHLSALDRRRTKQRRRHAKLCPRAICGEFKAESMLDCICEVTGHQGQVPRPAPRLAGRADRRRQRLDYFLTTFGRATARNGLLLRGENGATLSQALHLLNGDTTSKKIQQGGLIASWLTERRRRADHRGTVTFAA